MLLRKSLQCQAKLTASVTCTSTPKVMARALLLYFIAPPVWDVRKKWQFWTIVTLRTNLYGGARCY
jgi:hypothetical protein